MIRMEKVSKKFDGAAVLSSLTMDVPTGSTIALLGLSGSGKTTALKLICGLLFPDEGRVEVYDKIVNRENLADIRKKIGYVIQDGGLFPHLTAFANLALVGREAGFSNREIELRVQELSDMTKISTAALNRYPREISGGQRQRIGIMRALFLAPPLLLLDEPFGGLDPITRTGLQEDCKDLFAKMEKTVVLVTHDLYEAGFLAQNILLLNKGRIEQSGSMQDLVNRPATDFVQLFISSQRHKTVDII